MKRITLSVETGEYIIGLGFVPDPGTRMSGASVCEDVDFRSKLKSLVSELLDEIAKKEGEVGK